MSTINIEHFHHASKSAFIALWCSHGTIPAPPQNAALSHFFIALKVEEKRIKHIQIETDHVGDYYYVYAFWLVGIAFDTQMCDTNTAQCIGIAHALCILIFLLFLHLFGRFLFNTFNRPIK